MDSLGSDNGMKYESCGDSTQQDSSETNKTPRVSQCRPPKRAKTTAIPLYPIQLANDLLESAYNVKKSWSGERDLTEEARILEHSRMKNATTADEWKQAADRLDILEGNHYWKFEDDSDEFDMALLRKRLDRFKAANHADDMLEMLSLIRNYLKRDLARIGNPGLYKHTYVGTKHLIDEYTEVVKYTIERVADYCETASSEEIDRYLKTMKEAQTCFGTTALMLSGGGTLGMCHIGVVKALLEANVLPKVICGSSAGSIVGAVLCTQKRSEIIPKLDELCLGDMSVFQGAHERQGIPGMAMNIIKGDPVFDISNLCRVMRNLLGNMTFKEAFNKSSTILNIHVSSRDRHHTSRLLNYQTTPNIVIWSAVACSCSLPGVFVSPGLKEKNPRTGKISPYGNSNNEWIDGSVEGDLPSHLLQRLFNVNNFIASQVNPHVSMFLGQEGETPTLTRKTLGAAKLTAVSILENMLEGGHDRFAVKMVHAVLSQKYDGDITILPDIMWVPLHKILANPDHNFMVKATLHGERATWPKLDRIHNSVAIELAIERGVKQIVARKIHGTGIRRVPSATRSERGSSRRRRKSGSDGSSAATRSTGNLWSRGRRSSHRSARSMFEPLQTPSLFVPQTRTNHTTSSSDEARPSSPSPLTSYEDEDFQSMADTSDLTDDMEPSEKERMMLAFLSQPSSPSMSKKTFWGGEAANVPRRSAAAQVSTQAPVQPQPPGSPDNKKMFNSLRNGLRMSSIDSAVSFRKKRSKSREQ